uniref:Tudor domain-containing protein n=1 Tax=Ditylum brightwellii TaxID=49249 RepID=A0A7S1YYF4_9STRA|mmetsp:Transcript_20555/g.30529  ORF Transcript_20555/g.30529 Transcript_20555/m.30529 type:complete len:248 (+) Transcript_20555:171-914(+)
MVNIPSTCLASAIFFTIASSMIESVESSSLLRRQLCEQRYEEKTAVFKRFDNGWYWGKIVDFNSESCKYMILYEDNYAYEYEDGEELDQMIADAVNPEQLVPLDTMVYKLYEDGWWQGHVESYDPEDRLYTVRYNGDGETEEYVEGDEEFYEILDNAAYPQIYPLGVSAYKEFGEGWSLGWITEYNEEDNTYEVTFKVDYHSEEYPADDPELEEIIDAVYTVWMVNEEAEMEEEEMEEEVSGDEFAD